MSNTRNLCSAFREITELFEPGFQNTRGPT